MLCKNCGSEVPKGSLFCSQCGSEIEKEAKCPHCGNTVLPDSKFCTFCGKAIPLEESKPQPEGSNNVYTAGKPVSLEKEAPQTKPDSPEEEAPKKNTTPENPQADTGKTASAGKKWSRIGGTLIGLIAICIAGYKLWLIPAFVPEMILENQLSSEIYETVYDTLIAEGFSSDIDVVPVENEDGEIYSISCEKRKLDPEQKEYAGFFGLEPEKKIYAYEIISSYDILGSNGTNYGTASAETILLTQPAIFSDFPIWDSTDVFMDSGLEKALSDEKDAELNKKVKIQDCYTGSDYFGNPIIYVKYIWTNTTGETKSPSYDIRISAFQKGVSLDEYYDLGNMQQSKEVMPNRKITVTQGFYLENSFSDVEITIEPWLNMAGDEAVVVKKYSLRDVPDENYQNIPDYRTDNTSYDSAEKYVLPGSDSRYLTKSDLQGLSSYDCRIARNEIYARHGRKFNDASLQAYFDSCSWYTPMYSADEFNDSVLNAYEKANRDLIVAYEKEMGYR